MNTTIDDQESINLNNRSSNTKTLILLSFLAIYIIWGSTYLGIKYAIEAFPPFLMSGIRFLIAGTILYCVAEFQNAPKANFNQWKSSSIIGFLLLFIGNGGLVWAEQRISSGIAALLITIEPIWVLILQLIMKEKQRPGYLIGFAMIMAISGMILLVGPSAFTDTNNVDIAGFIVLMISTLGWAAGSLFAVKADLPNSPIRATSLQMLSGGVILLLAGTLTNEWSTFQLNLITEKSMYAFLYLIFFGSIIGYSAYSYLTRVATPGQVSTYAYINPVIAVFLGSFIGGEPLHFQTIIAAILLISAVVLIMIKPIKKG